MHTEALVMRSVYSPLDIVLQSNSSCLSIPQYNRSRIEEFRIVHRDTTHCCMKLEWCSYLNEQDTFRWHLHGIVCVH